MSEALKKGIGLFVVAFLLFYMITAPTEFALQVRNLAGAVGSAFEQIAKFFGALIS